MSSNATPQDLPLWKNSIWKHSTFKILMAKKFNYLTALERDEFLLRLGAVFVRLEEVVMLEHYQGLVLKFLSFDPSIFRKFEQIGTFNKLFHSNVQIIIQLKFFYSFLWKVLILHWKPGKSSCIRNSMWKRIFSLKSTLYYFAHNECYAMQLLVQITLT